MRWRVRWIHERPFTHLLCPFHDHTLAGLQPFLDDPECSASFPHPYRLNVDFIVRINDRHLIAPLQFRHGLLGHEQRTGRKVEFYTDAPELTRPKRRIGIRKKRCALVVASMRV